MINLIIKKNINKFLSPYLKFMEVCKAKSNFKWTYYSCLQVDCPQKSLSIL